MGCSRKASGRVAARAALAWVALGCNFDEAALFDEPPWYPGVVDGDAAVCTACMRASCSAERSDCTAHEDCLARLRCDSGCSDPNCINACDSEALTRQRACESTDGQSRGSAACVEGRDRLQALLFCALTDCELECNVGRNWGCVSAYTWTGASGQYVDERVWVRVKVDSIGDADFLAGVPGVEVREIRGEIEVTLGNTDAWGFLDFEQGLRGGVAPTDTRLIGTDRSYPIQMLANFGRPRVRDDAVRATVIPPAKYSVLFPPDLMPDPAQANVLVFGEDCLGAWGFHPPFPAFAAADVDLELEGATFTGASWTPTDLFERAVTTIGNLGAFLDVVPTGGQGAPVDVVMRRRSDGYEVGRTRITVELGWFTDARVLPRALD